MAGHYRMTRGWMDHSMFGSDSFCKRAAWMWLIKNAAFADHKVHVGGRQIDLKRGQLVASIRRLASFWKWEKTRVQRFLKKLERSRKVQLNRDSWRHSRRYGAANDNHLELRQISGQINADRDSKRTTL